MINKYTNNLHHFPIHGEVVKEEKCSTMEYYCKTCGKEFSTHNASIWEPHNEGCKVMWIAEMDIERAKK